MNLIIIGNGFDIAHEIPTRFSDFYAYLKKRKPDDVEKYDMLFRFGNQWKDFEEGLGNIKEDNARIVLKAFGINGIERSIKQGLQDAFSHWIINIDIAGSLPIFKLDNNNEYLSFNYTHTLEQIYRVSDKHIAYIHGCVGMGMYDKNEIIFGHIKKKGDQDIQPLLDVTTKDVEGIIVKHSSFFDRIQGENIDTIKVFGFSYSNVDYLYFEKIQKCLPNTKWILGYKSEDDKNNAYMYIDRMCLRNYELIKSEDVFEC